MARAAALALVFVALLAGAAAVAFSWQPGLATLHDDSASYLVMAQALSPWHAASPAVVAQMPYEKYPPLFPALLAITGAAFEWHWAHALVAICFAASVALLGLHAGRVSRSLAVGAAAAAMYAAMPGAWLNVKGILSEFPYMAIVFGTLAWLEGRQAKPWTARSAGALAVLLAAAMLTRTIGVALWIAVAIAQAAAAARERDAARMRAVAVALLAALAVAGLWYALRPAGGDDAYVSSSLGVMERVRADGPMWLASLVANNASALVDAWLNALVIYWGEWWQPRFLGAATIGVAALAAVGWRALRLRTDGLYVVAFLAVLLVWPYSGQMYRLALPVFPLALALLLCGVAVAARSRLPERLAVRAACYAAAVPLAFCAPALFYIAQRSRLPNDSIMELYRIPFRPDAEANAARQAAGLDDMARIGATTPAAARVMGYGPSYIALLAGRRAVPLDYPADAADMQRQISRARPDYVYLSHVHPRDSAHRLGDPFAPARFLEGRSEVIWWRPARDGSPDSALFRLKPVEDAR